MKKKRVVKAASSLFVLEYLKEHPGATGYDLCMAVRDQGRTMMSRVNGAVKRMSASGMICSDKTVQPNKYYSTEYYAVCKRVETLRELMIWFSQFDLDKPVTVYLSVDEEPTVVRVK
jgi:hypothetical protein